MYLVPKEPEEDVGSPGTELQVAVSHRLGSEISVLVLVKSTGSLYLFTIPFISKFRNLDNHCIKVLLFLFLF